MNDPWLDLQGLDTPLWGHHSFRRCADTVARATMAKTGVSEQDIDRVFGWLEALYSQRMQYHYETRFNRDKRYRVTMYLWKHDLGQGNRRMVGTHRASTQQALSARQRGGRCR